jgi:cell division protease FtsH
VSITPEEFAEAYRDVASWANAKAYERESPFAEMLREHFGADPGAFPITSEEIGVHERPNLQLALDAYLGADGRSHELVGVVSPHEGMELSLSTFVHEDAHFPAKVGAVQRTVVPLAGGESVSCVVSGLYLVRDGERRMALHIGGGESRFGRPQVRLDVMAPTSEEGEALVAELRRLMHEHNVFRGKVIALGTSGGDYEESAVGVTFVSVPEVERDDIVLPAGVLDTLELHTAVFSEHREALAAGGRHIRRGLLLHGPPGTGKTLTSMHLVRRLEGRTTLILTGGGLGLIGEAFSMARSLQPSLVILEDIDLVAHERTFFEGGASSLLFELLNRMDGIGEDADVIVLMTTNRAELLEPALAARPGRVDQAIEFPLPDAESRERLLELFCRGLDARIEDPATIVVRTDGASPAFIRELVRKAALYAARDGSATVTDAHFGEALEQLDAGGRLTRSLLGADGGRALDDLDEDDWDDDEDFE